MSHLRPPHETAAIAKALLKMATDEKQEALTRINAASLYLGCFQPDPDFKKKAAADAPDAKQGDAS